MKKHTLKHPLLMILVSVLCAAENSYGQPQTLDDQEVINIEGLYNTPAPRPKPIQTEAAKQLDNAIQSVDQPLTNEQLDQQPAAATSDDQRVNELKDLSRLAPFREVSVIQKKYLPKTERFQLYGGLGTTTNTPWFLNTGAKLGLSYNFTESFGLELTGMFLASSERQVAKEIRENNNLKPEQFIYTKGYYGLDAVWTPIYGKISYLDERIIPFDMYFSIGGGMSDTNSVEKSVGTAHIGMGQIFAITKSIAFRWDYSLNLFQATPISEQGQPAQGKGSYNDLILTAGISFFFPEAAYR